MNWQSLLFGPSRKKFRHFYSQNWPWGPFRTFISAAYLEFVALLDTFLEWNIHHFEMGTLKKVCQRGFRCPKSPITSYTNRLFFLGVITRNLRVLHKFSLVHFLYLSFLDFENMWVYSCFENAYLKKKTEEWNIRRSNRQIKRCYLCIFSD